MRHKEEAHPIWSPADGGRLGVPTSIATSRVGSGAAVKLAAVPVTSEAAAEITKARAEIRHSESSTAKSAATAAAEVAQHIAKEII